jgi:hypothetical protein
MKMKEESLIVRYVIKQQKSYSAGGVVYTFTIFAWLLKHIQLGEVHGTVVNADKGISF